MRLKLELLKKKKEDEANLKVLHTEPVSDENIT